MLRDRTPGATMEFHVARDARDYYRFDESLYALTGNVILANFHAARVFAQRMNQKRDLGNYCEQHTPQVRETALSWLNARIGATSVDVALLKFADEFPPLAVYRREYDAD